MGTYTVVGALLFARGCRGYIGILCDLKKISRAALDLA